MLELEVDKSDTEYSNEHKICGIDQERYKSLRLAG